jgi:hypothetical protein
MSYRITLSASSSSDSETTEDDSIGDFAFMATSVVSSHAYAATTIVFDIWYADSRASKPMTDRREWFDDFEAISLGLHAIQIADDTKIWTRGRGSIRINALIDGQYYKGRLHQVLYVPELKRNLFSVGLISERNLSFTTLPWKCEIRTLQGKKIMEGVRVNKLYHLSFTTIPNPVFTAVANIATTNPKVSTDLALISSSFCNDPILWHEQMGHVSFATMQKME